MSFTDGYEIEIDYCKKILLVIICLLELILLLDVDILILTLFERSVKMTNLSFITL